MQVIWDNHELHHKTVEGRYENMFNRLQSRQNQVDESMKNINRFFTSK